MTRTTIAVGVVDNDRLSLEMLKRIVLQQPIFTLKWAVSDSAVAIQSCLDTASRPDVLLTDMALDGMSGAELCNLVHQMAPRYGSSVSQRSLKRRRHLPTLSVHSTS